MKQEELCRKLTEMIAETKAQKLSWRLEVQTTEGNDASEKPIEEEHGTKWTIDECYASYSCNYRSAQAIWSFCRRRESAFSTFTPYCRTVWRCRRCLRITFTSSGCF